MNKRIGIIDLWKFIACILIMSHHIDQLIAYNGLFDKCWIYVEFFFMVTGFFTMQHFAQSPNKSLDEKALTSISYTLKKFVIFLPYTIPMIIIQYIIYYIRNFKGNMTLSSLAFFFDMLFDLLLIGDGNGSVRSALWFLCAMFVVFPIFCLICQINSKHFVYIIAFTTSILWCSYTDVSNVANFPYSLLRAFVFLMLGTVIYGIVSYVKNIAFKLYWKKVFTVIEEMFMLLTVYITCTDKEYHKFVILCFTISLILMLSGQTYTSQINNSLFTWLGELSMVIFITHCTTGSLISLCLSSLSVNLKIMLYYPVTFIVSILLHKLIIKLKQHIRVDKIFLNT